MWWRAIAHVFAMQWLAYLFALYARTYTKHHAMLCQRRTRRQATKKAGEKSKQANAQPRRFDEQKKSVREREREKKLTHKYLSSFILLFVCLGEMSMSTSTNMHIKHTVWCAAHNLLIPPPHQLCHVMFFMLLLLSLYHILCSLFASNRVIKQANHFLANNPGVYLRTRR